MATQHASLPSASQVNVDQLVDGYVELSSNQLDQPTKRKLIIIAIVAVLIIIVVAIVASVVEYNQVNSNHNWPRDCIDCGYGGSGADIFSEGEVDYVCGTRYDCGRPTNMSYPSSCFTDLNATNCVYLCHERIADYYDVYRAFYVATSNQCYCYTYSQQYNWGSSNNTYCHNITQKAEMYSIETVTWNEGRPYYLDCTQTQPLHSNITDIDCAEYKYYQEDEWLAFVAQNHSDIAIETINEWIHRGLAEHASIASFAKNALELMSIGAPLWMVELANIAGLDEMRHTQIAFDVVNMYLDGERCVKPNVFPTHNIEIDGDWNKISKDIAIGGCIGETLSALTISDSCEDEDVLNRYMDGIAMDEIKHAALAWVTVKWIIDTHPHNVDVISRQWWDNKLMSVNTNRNQRYSYAYDNAIPSILDNLWGDIDAKIGGYEAFYNTIIQQLEHDLKKNRADQMM
eukprot:88680_1